MLSTSTLNHIYYVAQNANNVDNNVAHIWYPYSKCTAGWTLLCAYY